MLPTKINATSYQGGGWESNEDDIEDSLSIVYMGNESIVSICQQFEALGMLHCSLFVYLSHSSEHQLWKIVKVNEAAVVRGAEVDESSLVSDKTKDIIGRNVSGCRRCGED